MPDRIAHEVRPVPAGLGAWAIESCTFTWIFDLRRRRFHRLPQGTSASGQVPPGDWVAYHQLDLSGDSGCFAVTLNADGTRILRSWIHLDPCRHCGPAKSNPASMVELAGLVERWRAELRAVNDDGRRVTGLAGWRAARPRRPSSARDGRHR